MSKLIIDTNLLALLVVGLTDRSYVTQHKRLREYELIDFDAVKQIVSRFDQVHLTPHVLSETSNIVSHTHEHARRRILTTLKTMTKEWGEVYLPSFEGMGSEAYLRLGLTDGVLIALSATGAKLITADHDLYLAALHAGHVAANYWHIRDQDIGF